MKNFSLLFFMLVVFIPAFTQIVIDETDMPEERDTLRVSLTTNIQGDYTKTGPDMTWDFSALNKMSQQVETFVSVLNTPSVYWLTFIPGIVSNLASPGNNLPSFPGIPLSNYYTFFNKSASLFSDIGFAFQLSGIPIMLKYDSADIYYTLPCTEGDTWTSNSFASISIPGTAYFGSSRTRTSHVDGWGTLTTPFGTYQAIRLKSEIIEYDSIFLDTLSVGFPVTRNITEYKWLGKGQGIPLLQVNEEGLVKTAIYRDIANHTGINEIRKATLQVFPNPSDGVFEFTKGAIHFPVHLQLSDTRGIVIRDENILPSTGKSVSLDFSSLPAGLYMIRLISKEMIYTGKVVILK